MTHKRRATERATERADLSMTSCKFSERQMERGKGGADRKGLREREVRSYGSMIAKHTQIEVVLVKLWFD